MVYRLLKPSLRIPWRGTFQRLNLPAISDTVHGHLTFCEFSPHFFFCVTYSGRGAPKGGGGGASLSSGTFWYAYICLQLYWVRYLSECEGSACIVRARTFGTSLSLYQTSLHRSPHNIVTAAKTSSPVMKIVSGKSWPQSAVYLVTRQLLLISKQFWGAFAKLRPACLPVRM